MSIDNLNLPSFDGSVKNNKKDKRCRNWSFIVYPDSAPDNWLVLLDEFHVPCMVSPLHDKDVNANGEPKKAHYHVMVLHDGNKSYDQIVEDYCIPLHGSLPQRVNNVKALARYFIHQDNPEKAQYNKDDIRIFGGIDIESMFERSSGAEMQVLHDMFCFIRENGITAFDEFVMMAHEINDEWFYLANSKYTFTVRTFIQSCYMRSKDKSKFYHSTVERLVEKVQRLEQDMIDLNKAE